MVEIDNEQLTVLMDACKQEYPEIDPYIIWVSLTTMSLV